MTQYRRPFVASFLAGLGGGFILLEGAARAALGLTIETGSTGAFGITAEGVGFLAGIEGTVIVLLAGLLYFMPEAHRGLGIGILTFSLLSLSVGGGFLIGALVGWLGGVAAIVARPSPMPEGEADDDWDSDLDDPVVEADLADAGATLPAPTEPGGASR
ncbi:MAG: hypothetical protein L3K15_03100 [Thermoplasmata archaeon]|nr:hypothetical protein [Thermoplasmata archaeon]